MPTSEEWRAIPSHPAYEVSRAGQIRRIGFARILKPATSHGYLHLSLGLASKNNRVHRLVAEAFLGPCPDGYQVNHKDGNRANPHVENLEYVTQHGNMQHAVGRIGEWGSIAETAARHRAKTHCPKGHPYDAANTFVYPGTRPRRGCRRCMYDASNARQKANRAQSRERDRRYRARKRQAQS